MIRSPARKNCKNPRQSSPFQVYKSPSSRPSSVKRGKSSRPALRSRNGRSLVAQFANCRKSERSIVSNIFATTLLFVFVFYPTHQLIICVCFLFTGRNAWKVPEHAERVVERTTKKRRNETAPIR